MIVSIAILTCLSFAQDEATFEDIVKMPGSVALDIMTDGKILQQDKPIGDLSTPEGLKALEKMFDGMGGGGRSASILALTIDSRVEMGSVMRVIRAGKDHAGIHSLAIRIKRESGKTDSASFSLPIDKGLDSRPEEPDPRETRIFLCVGTQKEDLDAHMNEPAKHQQAMAGLKRPLGDEFSGWIESKKDEKVVFHRSPDRAADDDQAWERLFASAKKAHDALTSKYKSRRPMIVADPEVPVGHVFGFASRYDVEILWDKTPILRMQVLK